MLCINVDPAIISQIKKIFPVLNIENGSTHLGHPLIAEKTEGHIYKVLKSKYFPESSIWTANQNLPKSAFWASIQKVLPLLKDHSCYQITQWNLSVWSMPSANLD